MDVIPLFFTGQVWKCIYCLEEKPNHDFTKTEHVIPQAFGVYRDNFTLNNIVCDTCNQFFGDHLERALARDTIKGLQRFEHSLKDKEDFKPFGKDSRMLMEFPDGEIKCALSYPKYSPEAKRILLYPCDQIGILNATGTRDFFLLEKILSKEELLSKYNLAHPQAVIILGDQSQGDAALLARGINLKIPEQPPQPDTNEIREIDCEVSGTIDKTIMRAIAKTAFNYLAHWQGPEFVLHKDFNIIRNFIRNGETADYRLVNIQQTAILGDEPEEGLRRSGHIVTVDWAGDGVLIIAQVSLMNWMKYSISLARNFSGEHRDIRKGHFFNFPDRTILPLTTDPRLAFPTP